MRIVVVGPGAIGCLFSASLAESGQDVFLLDKDPARARLISRKGIRIDKGKRSRQVRVRAVSDPAGEEPADVVLLCVKSYDTARAMRHARRLIGPRTCVCSFQNGLGNAEQIARVVPRGRIVCAATAHGSTHVAPGHVRHAGSGVTTLAPYSRKAFSYAQDLAGILAQAGLDVELTDDPAGMIWSKLIINAAINPVTAVAGVRNGVILERLDLRDLSCRAAREAEQVAKALGITLLYTDAVAETETVCRRTRDNFSSMLQDVRRGKRTEIDAISGAIVARARRLGVPVPVNARLLREVKRAECR